MKIEDLKKRAQIFKIMGNPLRLELLLTLSRGKICVNNLTELTGRRQANISQHLSVMRGMNIIDYHREGKKVCYFIKDKRVIKILRSL